MKMVAFFIMVLFVVAALLCLIGCFVFIMYHTESKFLIGMVIAFFLGWIVLQAAVAMRRGH